MQSTVSAPVVFSGIGLHGGLPVRMVIHPAPANAGISFYRSDLAARGLIPANWSNVTRSRLCTLLDNGMGGSVSTIEHVMAALYGLSIRNAVIEIDGPEIPIMDGSAAPFVRGILSAGITHQDAPDFALRILKPVSVRDGDAYAMIGPWETFRIEFDIEFPDAAIGYQAYGIDVTAGSFSDEIGDCRTFCRQSDVESMRSNGLALGGDYRNAVVVDGGRVLSPGGFRHPDEAVRHKILDAIGDLALAGYPILGRYCGHKAGHAMTNALLHALYADDGAWTLERMDTGSKPRDVGRIKIAA